MATLLIQQNNRRSKNDFYLFFKLENERKLLVLSWFDDPIIAGTKAQNIEGSKTSCMNVQMDDRGKFEWFLGMQISQMEERLTLDHVKLSLRNLACTIKTLQKLQGEQSEASQSN